MNLIQSEAGLLRDKVADVKQQEKHLTYIGSMRHKNAFTLYEINKKSFEVNEVKQVKTDTLKLDKLQKIKVTGLQPTKSKVEVRADCFYLEELNKKYALYKYLHNILKIPKGVIFAFCKSHNIDPKKQLPKELHPIKENKYSSVYKRQKV
ncbi:hypothetical protein FACS1894195_0170 [Bacteroidia bacterium]|nr:hypothetical protein FACS1894195_0170 [Bacteroidia bacterium]